METKQQKSLLSYSKFSSSSATSTRQRSANVSSSFKCQICGAAFNAKRTYLSHLKKCSLQNSVQLKHVINFAAQTSAKAIEEKPAAAAAAIVAKKKEGAPIKSRVIKMEIPQTEDDEQQQLVNDPSERDENRKSMLAFSSRVFRPLRSLPR